MNLETKSNVMTNIYTNNELTKNISNTQIKRYSDSAASFASEMKTSTEQQEPQETPKKEEVKDSALKADKSEETSKKEEVKKTETKKTDKTAKKDNQDNQTLNGEISNDNYDGGSQAGQLFQGGGDNRQNEYTPLTDKIQAYMNANGVDLNFVVTNPMSATSRSQIAGMTPVVDYSSIQMSDGDAKFFADLVAKTDMTAASVAAEFEKQMQQGNVKMVQSTAKSSIALIEALKESSKNHQAFRIDFDKDISVIMQVDKGGKINANFIPGDKAVEAYLRNNIDFLRQRFNEENIAYGDLTYSQSRRQRQEQENKNNNKENAHE